MTNDIYCHERHTVSEAYQTFFEALQYNSIPYLVKIASIFFGVPVLLTNEHYQLISLYPEREVGVFIYDTLYKNRILPRELVTSYQQEYLNDDAGFHYEPFYASTGQVSDCPRIFGEVYSGDRIYG
ncbi:MAG: hypothetical protein IJM62_02955, partial [Lachnospiraceae bacterium]|nr:hypothetical protein [Lachnospiraceae bacterium]